jgi:hypothetical protein
MQATHFQTASIAWLVYAFLTVVSWGVYGLFLHTGQLGMADKENGRYMAFLYVGIAYVLVAVLAPLVMLKLNGGRLDFWNYPTTGLRWSLIAGTVGAVGAFGVLLAFGAAPQPKAAYVPVVMSIIFAGAPIVNAFASMMKHPPEGGYASIQWPFWLGIALAAIGGALVTQYKPDAVPPAKPPVVSQSVSPPATPLPR